MRRGWVRAPLIWAVATVVAGASSCSSLPDIDRGVCGNGVVEPDHSEDCDNGITDDAGHPTCYPAGAVAACPLRLLDHRMPNRFLDGNDAVCRKPAENFQKTSGHADADRRRSFVWSCDFDHDGQATSLRKLKCR